jgi:hypothetical protein
VTRAHRLGALVIAASITASAPASARPKKPGINVSAEVSASRVAVGERFVVTLRVRAGSDEPRVQRPLLEPLPPGVAILGYTLGSHTYLINGKVSRGVDAVWNLRATKPGRVMIPGPSAIIDGKKITTGSISVEVVAAAPGASSAPASPSPFLMPGMPSPPSIPGMPNIPWPFGDDTTPDDEPQPTTRADLDMKEPAPDARAFLRAIVDKTSAVVGEQITARYYVYCAAPCSVTGPKEPDFVSFRRVDLERGEPDEPQGTARVHGESYLVKLIGRTALFPLATGDLQVGAMERSVAGRRFPPYGELRTSNSPTVHVTEPPLAGRPPGYAIGDVGSFSITAGVQPQKVDVGGSVAVMVRVTGTGLVPDSLRVPERSGVEWLDPVKKERTDVQAGKVVGTRTFDYVVRLKNSGMIDLGAIELPYWDPAKKKYEVAKAAAGEVEVAHVAGSGAEVDDKPIDEPLSTLPLPRKELGAFHDEARTAPLAGSRFWSLVVAPPLGLALLAAADRARREIERRRREGAASPRTAAERALEQANAAISPRDVAAAVERATHASVEAAFSVKSRGLLLGELGPALERAGASADEAARVAALLAACDGVRFVPGDAAADAANDLRASANDLVRGLLRGAARSRRGGAA